ncbi:glucuronyl esterase domain-containing protein [Echinicola salinicaeni]|uniref:glucuronyl esterase domain-containing protein n=1 Tax=Echinicola salinicaeni TaxID=2762757 RepID=UPI001C93E135|nr:acetylxylan esterase [Echinicola salinicaeni]
MMNRVGLISIVLLFLCHWSYSQSRTNYDEEQVPQFEIPDPLMTFSGEQVEDAKTWLEKRRPELMDFFTTEMFGKIPGELGMTSFKILEEGPSTVYSGALRQQVKISIIKGNSQLDFNLLLYLPKGKTKAPIFLGPNFYGNHSVTLDEKVVISDAWARNNPSYDISDNSFTETSRGVRSYRWAIQDIIDAGFGLATFYYGEIDPDKNDFSDGIHPFFYQSGQSRPKNGEWGSIAAWAWGMSRAMDYLQENEKVDSDHIIAFGHSRLGKTALWAAANDDRFAAAISNNSGCGGAALSKRKYGETLAVINKSFPHWFTENFKKYGHNEEKLPVDQHELISLIAPRPVYVASAVEDRWADPKGEYLGAYYSGKVYKLFGKSVLENPEMPEIHQPLHQSVAYHIREGKHNVTDYDWGQYLKWASDVVMKEK